MANLRMVKYLCQSCGNRWGKRVDALTVETADHLADENEQPCGLCSSHAIIWERESIVSLVN